MEIIKQIENRTEYYLDDRLLLTITKNDNNSYITENDFARLEGICKPLDEHRTQVILIKNCVRGKNGRLYDTKKLLSHNASWFLYILEEKGFVKKSKSIS